MIFFILSIESVYSQTRDSIFFQQSPETISQVSRKLNSDTMVFYFNGRWEMVNPICAEIFRITRVDSALGTFKDAFIDYYVHDSTTAVEGTYRQGKKEGRFAIYFPNGQIAEFGSYANDKKDGLWEYFYEDGTRRQVFEFQDEEIFIKEFWNEQGKQLVEAGNGEWFGFEPPAKVILVSGEVLNGRKSGQWTKAIPSRKMTTNIERYKEGRFLGGKMFSIISDPELYKDTPYCRVENVPAFLKAEAFQTMRCFSKQTYSWEMATYPGGNDRLYRQIKEKIILRGPIAPGIVRVEVLIDKDGFMKSFTPFSNVGYEQELIQTLKTMDRWTPTKVNGVPTFQTRMITIKVR